MSFTKLDKAKIIIGAILLHLSIGSIYAFSVFVNPLVATFGFELPAVQFIFSLAIAALGISAAFVFGKFVEKHGARKTALISTVLFSMGMIGTGLFLTLQIGALVTVYVFFLILGCGLGAGYTSPVSSLLKLFPDKKGLAGGIAVFAFGLGAAICSPIATYLLNFFPVQTVFIILGIAYFFIMLGASFLLPNKPFPVSDQYKGGLVLHEALSTKTFYKIWTLFAANIFCGIAIISIAAPMAITILSITPMEAAFIVSIISICNGIGRPIFASLADKFTPKNMYTTIFLLQIIALACIVLFPAKFIIVTCLGIIGACYGAGFSILPSYVASVYGFKNVGAIHAALLTGWSFSGIFAPLFIALMVHLTGTYSAAMLIFMLIFIVMAVLSRTIKKEF